MKIKDRVSIALAMYCGMCFVINVANGNTIPAIICAIGTALNFYCAIGADDE